MNEIKRTTLETITGVYLPSPLEVMIRRTVSLKGRGANKLGTKGVQYTSIVSGASVDRIISDAVNGYWIKRQGKLREAAEGSLEKWNAMFQEFELSPTGLHLYKESYLESGTRIEAPPTVEETLDSAAKLSVEGQTALLQGIMEQLGLSVEELADLAGTEV